MLKLYCFKRAFCRAPPVSGVPDALHDQKILAKYKEEKDD